MSNQAPPELRAFAQALLDGVVSSSGAPIAGLQAVESVCAKVRAPICTLAGAVGFRALLGRALSLAKGEVPALQAVKVTSEGALEGVAEFEAAHDKDVAAEAGLILLTRLLGLLATFIGTPLTERLLRDIWPETPNLDQIPKGPVP